MRVRYDWDAVQRFYDAGHGRDECVAEFGFSLIAWYKAIRRGRLHAHLERQIPVDWPAVQRFYDEGHNFRECKDRFGFAAASWSKAIRRGALVSRPRQRPLELILKKSRSRCTIKRRLLMAGKLVNRCDFCGLSEWRGQPLSIQIDHINGVRDDHRIENLRMLCPNCHSQTGTYAGRNKPLVQEDQHSRVV
jgi:HNH endonuclease